MRTRHVQDYGIAVLTVVGISALHAALEPWLGRQHNTAFMVCAVAVTLATGGPGPAILTAVLAFLSTVTLFGQPGDYIALGRPGGATATLMYAVACAVMIALGGWHARRARRERAAHARDVQMLDLVTDCFFVLDRQWRFTHINDPALRYFNLQAQQVLGRDMWEEFPLTRGTPIETLFREVERSGKAGKGEILAPVSKRWLDVRAVPTGRGVMVVFTDVTQRRLAQD